MGGRVHVRWEEILDAVESGRALDPEVETHLRTCPVCARATRRIQGLLELLAERRALSAPDPSLREATLRALRAARVANRETRVREVWARVLPVQPSFALRGTEPVAVRVFEAEGYRISWSERKRAGRRVVRGQVVGGAGDLPAGGRLEVSLSGAVVEVPLDAFGEFALDPAPAAAARVDVLLGPLRVRLPLDA